MVMMMMVMVMLIMMRRMRKRRRRYMVMMLLLLLLLCSSDLETENLNTVSEFYLLDLSDDPELHPVLFGIFLFMYLTTVLGNMFIILALSSDPHLQTPMYFFLCKLSLADMWFTSTTVPKMLVNIQNHSTAISYGVCLSQMSFFLFFDCMHDMLLTVMAYDRFVAICRPLQYPVLLNTVCFLILVLVSGILYSYYKIISSILRIPTESGRHKAFSTCGAHLSVVCFFCGTLLGSYCGSTVFHGSKKLVVASVMYTVVSPMLNPFIYSPRNRDISRTLTRLGSRILGTQDLESALPPQYAIFLCYGNKPVRNRPVVCLQR
ncbi:olfactory receptor 7E24-like [Thomomys bottae]